MRFNGRSVDTGREHEGIVIKAPSVQLRLERWAYQLGRLGTITLSLGVN